MRLINIQDGVEICFNQNEKNIETVFGINDNCEIIQNLTFLCDIFPNYTKIINHLSQAEIEEIDSGFLFYSFRYQISFAHFLCQTVPKLKNYIQNYSNYKLLIPIQHYSIITQNILEILNIKQENIFLLENKIYDIKHFERGGTYSCVPDMYTEDHLWIYNTIRDNLKIPTEIYPKKRKIYLKRDGIPNTHFGNSETGIYRFVINEDDLIKKLEGEGFEIITLGDKTIYEKRNLLQNVETVITLLGSNCMNFIFSEYIKNFIILTNAETAFFSDFYKNLIEELNKTKINWNLLTYTSNKSIYDPTNSMNSPFTVDVEQILNNINNLP